jgi:uncharacterized membrane protein YozB (DUF420 family)
MNIAQYIRWDVAMMCLAMAVLFAFEMLGVFTDKYITITALVRMYMPKWMRAMILGWMVYHFMFGE